MTEQFLRGYLAGAIRDDRQEDIDWREKMITEVPYVSWINPLGGKIYDPATKRWTMSGIEAGADTIVKHDFWAVDHVDFVVFNFTALSEKYPNIGTLVEFGRSTKTGALIYSLIDKDYIGHESGGMFKLHPFIEKNSAAVFNDLPTLITFLQRHAHVLDGSNPRFDGLVNAKKPWYAAR